MAEEEKDCCGDRKDKSFLSGLLYGLIPHSGCIAFIIFTVLGVTAATSFLKPLMLNAYFFYILIALSLVFATLSAFFYLKRFGIISLDNIKARWKYLSILYGTTIGINLLLFMVIFPIVSNMATGMASADISGSDITLKVDIPCPGHAPLISGELDTIDGVEAIKFRFPDYFDVTYDPSKTSKDEILLLDVFETYSAEVVGISPKEDVKSQESNAPVGCSRCGSCDGTCGGTCSG